MERGLEGGRERRRETEGPGLSVPDPCQHGRRGGRFRSRDAGGVTECRREGDESRGRERGKVMGERGSGGGELARRLVVTANLGCHSCVYFTYTSDLPPSEVGRQPPRHWFGLQPA